MTSKPCCCGNCDIASDAFNRADSSDIGAAWDEVAGDWEIASNELRTSSSDAIARHQAGHPDDEFGIRVIVDVLGEDDGDVIRVYGPMWGDNDAIFAELVIDDGDCATLTLYQLIGGTATQVGGAVVVPAASDEQHRITLCYRNDYPLIPHVTVKIATADGTERWTGAAVDVTGNTPDMVGVTGGLGTGAITTAVRFDNFRVVATREATNQERCPRCNPPCDLFEDDFMRADSTDVGCEWTEVSGGWEISSNALSNTSAGQIRCNVPVPDPEHFIVTVFISGEEGDVAKIIGNWDVDGGTYVYGRVTIGTSIGLYLSDGTELATKNKSTFAPLASGFYTLCFDGEQVVFGTPSINAAGIVEANYTATDGEYAGLEGDGNVAFDDFELKQSASSLNDNCEICWEPEDCGDCDEDHPLPNTLTLDLTNLDFTNGLCGACEDLNAVFVLERRRTSPCSYLYDERLECEMSGGKVCGGVMAPTTYYIRLLIVATLQRQVVGSATQRRWSVQIFWQTFDDPGPQPADDTACTQLCEECKTYTFTSAWAENECDETPITLSGNTSDVVGNSNPFLGDDIYCFGGGVQNATITL